MENGAGVATGDGNRDGFSGYSGILEGRQFGWFGSGMLPWNEWTLGVDILNRFEKYKDKKSNTLWGMERRKSPDLSGMMEQTGAKHQQMST